MEKALIHAYQLTGDRAGRAVSEKEIIGLLEAESLAWAHLQVGHPETGAFLRRALKGLDPAILQALVVEETRPRATEIGDGFLIVLRGASTADGEEAEDLVSLRMWIDGRRIISLQRKKLQAAIDLSRLIEAGGGPDSPGRFLAALVEGLTRRIEPVLTELDDSVDDIEERVISKADHELRGDLVDLRRRTIHLRRYLGPQRDALTAILAGRVSWFTDGDRRSLHESHDRVQRMVEDLDAVRDRAQIIKDELTNALADRMNRNMYLLSVIGAIFLPLGFLTGLMGVNIGGMPGVDDSTAFWIFSGLLAAFVIVELALFRLLKWL
jgi:zinc transporter